MCGVLEHVAAGVEDEIRALARLGRRTAVQAIAHPLAEPREIAVVELHTRKHVGAVGDQTEILDALPAAFARLASPPRQGDARHRQQETRIDALRTDRDAVAGERTALGPGLRRLRPVAETNDIEHAGNHRLRRGVADAGRPGHRTDLHALAAPGAGIEHFARAGGQRLFKNCFGHMKIPRFSGGEEFYWLDRLPASANNPHRPHFIPQCGRQV